MDQGSNHEWGTRPPTFAPTETLPGAIEEWATKDPGRPYLIGIDGAVRSYADVHDAALRWANGFRRIGVQPGENVAAMIRPGLSAIERWLGLSWVRAIQTGVNTDFRGNSLVYALNNSRTRRFLCQKQYLDRLAEIAPRLETLELAVVTDAAAEELPGRFPVPLITAQQIWEGSEPAGGLQTPCRHDIACIAYTSGTTGPSKGVLVPWGRFWPEVAWLDLDQDDVYYDDFPFFHLSGMVPLAWMAFVGGRVVIRESFKTQRFWDDIRRFGCTTTALIPVMMNWLLDQPAMPDDLDNPLRIVSGAPVVPRVDEFKKRFGVQMRTVYSTTEAGMPLYAGPDVSADRASTGKWTAPGYQARIVDDHDYEVPPGAIGELLIRCDQPWRMMAGYFGMVEKTAEAWRNGWFHTGDGFVQDEAGHFHFVDRITDSMRRRGENISSMEVEAYANEHPAVAESAAIGVPSQSGEDEVKICVVLHDGVELAAADLRRFLADRMPAFMVPRYIEFLVDPERTEAMQRIKKPPLRIDPLNNRTWDAEGD